MGEAELRALGEDIKANGLRNPIVVWGPAPQMLIDGRNRLDAMELVDLPTHDGLGLTVPMRLEPSTKDPTVLVVSLNLKRRILMKAAGDGCGQAREYWIRRRSPFRSMGSVGKFAA
jgi:hypothetical protein